MSKRDKQMVALGCSSQKELRKELRHKRTKQSKHSSANGRKHGSRKKALQPVVAR